MQNISQHIVDDGIAADAGQKETCHPSAKEKPQEEAPLQIGKQGPGIEAIAIAPAESAAYGMELFVAPFTEAVKGGVPHSRFLAQELGKEAIGP